MAKGKFILEREHVELMESLYEASNRKDHFGKLFENVLKIFRYHNNREVEVVLPLLEYMSHRYDENRPHDLFRLQKIWNDLKEEYDSLLNEHKQITRIIGEIEDYPSLEEDNIYEIVHELRRQIELEEEILYPAALVVGELIQYSEFR